MNARCSAAASCCSTMSIVTNSMALARCARRALPTCLLPCWEISWARRLARPKERPYEYSSERNAGVLRLAGGRARSHVGDPTDVLVGAARIVGEPFDLCRAAGRRRRLSARLLDQPDLAAGQHARH